MSCIISRTCAGGAAAAGTCAGDVWAKLGEITPRSTMSANIPDMAAFKTPAPSRSITALQWSVGRLDEAAPTFPVRQWILATAAASKR
ncbi:hypothetical protein OS035_15925 [Rhizobium sp. 268]|uniref:hypothetical protein n=1 Tax=unclassified Rhizobium TaxID=2613769 RepID=UPI002F94A980